LHTLEKEPERRYQHASEVKTDLETIARTPDAKAAAGDASAAASAFEEVRSPASWLLATGVLNWIAIPAVVLAIAWARSHNGQPTAPMLLPLLAALGLSSVIIFAALKMRRLEAYSTAVIGSILAILITPGNIIGLPVGIWSLVVLSRREVRQAFGRGYGLPSAIAGASPPAPAPDRFWRHFAVAVALVLLALTLIPIGLTVLSIALPTLSRARMKAHQAATTNLVEAASSRPSADAPPLGTIVSDNPPAGVMPFATVIERVLSSVTAQRPIKGEDFDSGREIEVPVEIEKAGEQPFFHWLAGQGVDLLAFAHNQSWDLWVAPKLSSVPSGLWERPVEAELMAALESGAAGLVRVEPDEKSGFVSYGLGSDRVLPLTFAFRTRAGGVGLLQIAEFTESPRGIRIRYKLAAPARSPTDAGSGASMSSGVDCAPIARAEPGEFNVTLANGMTLEVVAMRAALSTTPRAARLAPWFARSYSTSTARSSGRVERVFGLSNAPGRRFFRRSTVSVTCGSPAAPTCRWRASSSTATASTPRQPISGSSSIITSLFWTNWWRNSTGRSARVWSISSPVWNS